MRNRKQQDTLFTVLMVVASIVWLAIIVAAIVIGIHFLQKVW